VIAKLVPAVKVELFVGLVMLAAGSALAMTLMAAEFVTAPRLSVAFAVSE